MHFKLTIFTLKILIKSFILLNLKNFKKILSNYIIKAFYIKKNYQKILYKKVLFNIIIKKYNL